MVVLLKFYFLIFPAYWKLLWLPLNANLQLKFPDSLQKEDVWLHNNLPEKMILRDHLDVLVLLTLIYVSRAPKLRQDSPANVNCWAKKEAPVAPAETNRNRQCK